MSDGYKLQHFVNERTKSEFVVIVGPGEDIGEYMEDPDVLPMESFEIVGDCASLPCDRELRG